MMLPFLPRLICICLAALFLVNLFSGSVVCLMAPWLVRFAARMRAGIAVSLLISFRLLPPALTLLTVAWIAANYPRLEPKLPVERVGAVCFLCAFLGTFVWGSSLVKGCRSWIKARRYLKNCRRAGVATRLPGERIPALVVASQAPFFLMAGIFQQRLIVSQSVIRVLSTAELAVAVRHERAHRVGRDNLKRLLILLSPGLLPFVSGFKTLDDGWTRLAEWAADDRAVAGNPQRSFLLAQALVRLARESVCPAGVAVGSTLLGSAQNLSVRVDRLLNGVAPRNRLSNGNPFVVAAAVLMLAICLVSVAELPSTLRGLHRVLERFHRAGNIGHSRS